MQYVRGCKTELSSRHGNRPKCRTLHLLLGKAGGGDIEGREAAGEPRKACEHVVRILCRWHNLGGDVVQLCIGDLQQAEPASGRFATGSHVWSPGAAR